MGWMRTLNRHGGSYVYQNYIYIYIWNFLSTKSRVHMPILWVVENHWLHDECPSQWTWMPTLLEMVQFTMGNTHIWAKKLLPPSSLSDLYELQNHFRAFFSFKLELNLTRLGTIYFFKNKRISILSGEPGWRHDKALRWILFQERKYVELLWAINNQGLLFYVA